MSALEFGAEQPTGKVCYQAVRLVLLYRKLHTCISGFDGWKAHAESKASAFERIKSFKKLLVGGIEPSTLGLLDPRSNQLSYTSSRS
jgi:hypothetical protein